MNSDVRIDYSFDGQIPDELRGFFNARRMTKVNRAIGINVRENVADHIARASVTRHKSADRLGAQHSKFLEFAPARGRLKGGSKYRPTDGNPAPYTEVRDISENGSTVVVGNTPGLRRAFGPLTITPKNAKALTIPINKDAYAKKARSFRNMVCITTRKGHGLLALKEDTGKGHLRPMYLLVKKSVVPQDPGLLPTKPAMEQFAEDGAISALELEVSKFSGG